MGGRQRFGEPTGRRQGLGEAQPVVRIILDVAGVQHDLKRLGVPMQGEQPRPVFARALGLQGAAPMRDREAGHDADVVLRCLRLQLPDLQRVRIRLVERLRDPRLLRPLGAQPREKS